MLRTFVSLMCAIAVLAPAAAFAGEPNYRGYHNRGDDDRHRTVERVRTIDFYNRNREFDRRDTREWNRRDAERERYWRDRRDDRLRRDYRRDRFEDRRVIIIPHFSF